MLLAEQATSRSRERLWNWGIGRRHVGNIAFAALRYVSLAKDRPDLALGCVLIELAPCLSPDIGIAARRAEARGRTVPFSAPNTSPIVPSLHSTIILSNRGTYHRRLTLSIPITGEATGGVG